MLTLNCLFLNVKRAHYCSDTAKKIPLTISVWLYINKTGARRIKKQRKKCSVSLSIPILDHFSVFTFRMLDFNIRENWLFFHSFFFFPRRQNSVSHFCINSVIFVKIKQTNGKWKVNSVFALFTSCHSFWNCTLVFFRLFFRWCVAKNSPAECWMKCIRTMAQVLC